MKCSRCADYVRTLVCVFVVLSLADCKKRRAKRGNGKCSPDTLVEYNLSFFGDWSKDAFPRMYPKYRPHAQWSKLYGLTHGRAYKLWSEGDLASPAVKKFVEERSTLILEKHAQGYNDTYDIFTAAPIRGGIGRTSVRIFADGKHSKVSFLVKIIPSPDWFVGVDGLDLCRNGRWRRKVYAHLRPLDAGTDKGLTYTSPNWPSHPPQKIYQITPSFPDHPASSFFYPDRTKLPRIAHAIVERVSEYHKRGRTTAVRYNAMPNMEVTRQEHELIAARSSSMSVLDDEEDIPLNTKLDEALVEKLENDIQRKLRTAPRQTFFLQRMMKNGGQPLADQSSEEIDHDGDGSEVKSAASFLEQKVSIRQTTMFVPPPSTTRTTTTMPTQKPPNENIERFSGLETMRRTEDDNDSREEAGARLDLRPPVQIQKESDEGRQDISVEQPTEGEESLQVDNDESQPTDVKAIGASSHQQSNPSYDTVYSKQENPSIVNAPGREDEHHREENMATTTPSLKSHIGGKHDNHGADSELGRSPDYAAAFSVSSARTIDDTRGQQDSDFQHQNNQYRSNQNNHDSQGQHHDNQEQPRDHYDNQEQPRDHYDNQEQPRDHYDNQDPQRHHRDRQHSQHHHHDRQDRQSQHHDRTDPLRQHHDNREQPRNHYDNQKHPRNHYDNQEPDSSYSPRGGAKDGSLNDGNQDTYPGHDNVETETNQRDVLTSLGILDNDVRQEIDSDEQLDCLVGEWTEWSSCTKTCGFGVKTRTRQVIQHSQNGGLNCPRLSLEVLCGSMRTCRWNYFNSMFGKYKDPQRRRRRRKRRHHRS